MAGFTVGSSAVIIHMKIMGKNWKVNCFSPVLCFSEYMDGTFTSGTSDNKRLTHIANRLANYLVTNPAAAIGGPTGAQPMSSCRWLLACASHKTMRSILLNKPHCAQQE
ncbi:MAG: hypothetical protein LBH10_02545 [Burkholderiaceae bacterium]|nr:hypothetical protein [Burkholderiaceae bacterium]